MAARKSREDPQTYVLRKNYAKAIELYREILESNPDDAKTLLRLADCLALDNQIPQAVAEYRKAANVYAEQGFLLKAIGVNKKIVRLDPSQTQIHEDLSRLYEERGLLSTGASDAEVAATSAAGDPGAAAAATGAIQFDMEEATEGAELDLGLAPPATDVPTASSPAVGEEPPTELSVDDLAASLAEVPAGAVALDDLEALGLDLSPDAFPAAPADSSRPALERQKVPLFSDFTPEEFVEVVTQMAERDYAADEVVVREGDAGDSLFVIVHGSVRVETQAGGKTLRLAELHEGEFFGEGSLITGKPRTATISANEASELLSLSKASLDAIVAKHPRVRDVMMQFYQRRAESTVQVILRQRR